MLSPAMALLAACALLAAPSPPAPDVRDLVPGEPQPVVLAPGGEDVAVFRVRVPPRATALRVRTLDATADVDLYASFETEPDPRAEDWEVAGEGTWVDEDLLIDVTDWVPLDPGEWFFAVSVGEYVTGDVPVTCLLSAELVEIPTVELRPGARTELVLRRDEGLRAALVPVVSAGANGPGGAWRVEVFSPVADVDLLVGPSRRDRPHRAPWASAESALSWESVAVTSAWLERGALLHVFGLPELEALDEVPVSVLLSPAASPPGLVPPPRVPDGSVRLAAEPFAAAVAATVSIFGGLGGGSGVVISADGRVVTNAHVVAGLLDGASREPTACGFTLDPRVPPTPAFLLELLDHDRTRDLALLRIASTLDGAPLSAELVFPTLPLATPEEASRLEPGDELYGVGFPMTGGSGSFVTVTLTRGILSGFAREREGLLYKTDAGIHSGVSGGAILDAAGRLVAIPSSSISDANMAGGMGFALPLELLPEGWRP